MHINKVHNVYAAQLGALFDQCPKAVLAAIAVSALTNGGDRLDEAAELVAREWEALNLAGIVPQPPSKLGRQLAEEVGA